VPPWEHVEDRGRLGGDDAVDDGGQGAFSFQGGVDERDHDGVALVQEDVGELHHGDEVADGEARVQDHGLLHGLAFALGYQ